jgi:hypothetical protein
MVLPRENGSSWLLAAAHGMPWCTSNISGFSVDLLQPDSGSTPAVLAHEQHGYRRETEPVIKPAPGGFQLRMTGSSLDGDIVMRPVIYRYQVASGKLKRIQPIANNGRDFVDEWLESPWSEAASWVAPAHRTQLEAVHKHIATLYDGLDPDGKQWPSVNFGPVRGCADSPAHFQVEVVESWRTAQQLVRKSRHYFQIEQGKNSFTLLSAAATPDPHCTGPDIMPKN